jgi:excisionase family DNA binding protein
MNELLYPENTVVNKTSAEKVGRGKRRERRTEIEPAYATVVEAAAFMRISRGMVVKMIKAGEIPWRRFGRNFRIPWCWLRNQVPQ